MDRELLESLGQKWQDLVSQREREEDERRRDVEARKIELEAQRTSARERLGIELEVRKKQIEEQKVNAEIRFDKISAQIAAQIADLQRLLEDERETSKKSVEKNQELAATEIEEQGRKIDQEFTEKHAELVQKAERDDAKFTSEWEEQKKKFKEVEWKKQEEKYKEAFFEAFEGNVSSMVLPSPSPAQQSIPFRSVPAQVDAKSEPEHALVASPNGSDSAIEYVQSSKIKKGTRTARRGRKGHSSGLTRTHPDRRQQDQRSRLESPSSEDTLLASNDVYPHRARSSAIDERSHYATGRARRELSSPSTRSQSRNDDPLRDTTQPPRPESQRPQTRRRPSMSEDDAPSSKRAKTSSADISAIIEADIRSDIGMPFGEGRLPVMAASKGRIRRSSRGAAPNLSSFSISRPDPLPNSPKTKSELLGVFLGTISSPRHKNDKSQPEQLEQHNIPLPVTLPEAGSVVQMDPEGARHQSASQEPNQEQLKLPAAAPQKKQEQTEQQAVNQDSAPQHDQANPSAKTKRSHWTEQEDTYLLQARAEGISFKDIGAQVGRSEASCRRHNYRLFQKGTPGAGGAGGSSDF